MNLGLHEKLAAYFHLQSGESALLESAIENPVTTVSDQGISVTIRQTLANSSGLYVLYEVTTPESIALDPEKNWHMEGSWTCLLSPCKRHLAAVSLATIL